MAAPRGELKLAQQSILQVLKIYTASPVSTLESTIASLTTPIELAYTSGENGKADGLLWSLWDTLLRYARTIPWETSPTVQDSLVHLLAEIRKRQDPPKPSKSTDEDLLAQWGYPSIWSSLVVFGAACREEFDECPGSRPTTMALLEQAAEYANVCAFMARVTKAGICDFSIYALWALRDTIESPDPEYPNSANHNHELDAFLPAAAVWISILAPELWARIGGEANKEVNELQWELIVTKEMWVNWIQNFVENARRKDLLDITSQLEIRAGQEMEDAMEPYARR